MSGAEGDVPLDEPLLRAAVRAGLTVLDRLPAGAADAPASAGLEVLAAAATAATAAGVDVAAAIDLAGTLAVIGPPVGVTTGADVRAGHALAVGWLAVRLLADGLVAPEGAAFATATTVLGSAPTWPAAWS